MLKPGKITRWFPGVAANDRANPSDAEAGGYTPLGIEPGVESTFMHVRHELSAAEEVEIRITRQLPDLDSSKTETAGAHLSVADFGAEGTMAIGTLSTPLTLVTPSTPEAS